MKSFLVRVRGKYACFTDLYHKVERYSYPVITPSAARGIFDSVYWHPGVRYSIDKIYVLNPINRYHLMTNEVGSVAPTKTFVEYMKSPGSLKQKLYIDARDHRQQRNSVILKDVDYIIKTHIEIDPKKKDPTNNLIKANAIFKRRLEKGQCWSQPFLGMREFGADLELFKGKITPEMLAYRDEVQDLSFMLYDMDYITDKNGMIVGARPLLFHSVLDHGVIDLENCEVFGYDHQSSR